MSVSAGPKLNITNLELIADVDNKKSYSGSGTTWYNLIDGLNASRDMDIFDGSSAFTVSIVIDIIGTGTGYAWQPISKWTGTTDAAFSMYHFGAFTDNARTFLLTFYANAGGVWGGISGQFRASPGNTYHIVLQYNSTTGGQLWANGVKIGGRTGSGIVGSTTAPINYSAGALNVSGIHRIESAQLYSREISDTEVLELYRTLKPKIISIVDDGLLINYDANSTYSANSSSNTFYNTKSTSYYGTLVNGASFITTSPGYAYFDGVDDYAYFGTIPNIGINTSSWSMAVWIQPNDTTGNIISMSDVFPVGNWNMPPLSCSSSRFLGYVWGTTQMAAPQTYTLNQWYYVVLVNEYNATVSQRAQYLYVNGVCVAGQKGQSYSGSGVSNYLYLCQSNPGAGNQGMLTANIGTVQIYNSKALTPDEVKQNFNATRSRYGI